MLLLHAAAQVLF